MQPVLLIVIFTGLSAAVMNNEKCLQPSSKAIEDVLIEMLSVPVDDIIIVLEAHYLCLAVRAYNMYDSMSIVTMYTINEARFIAQFDVVCTDGSVWQPRAGSLNTSVTIELFSITTSTMCYQCNYDVGGGKKAPMHDSTTHCIRKFMHA